MSHHTLGTWIIVPQSDGSAMIAREFETGKQLNPKGLRLIAHVLARGNTLAEDEANARRIVACVTACAGLSIEDVERLANIKCADVPDARGVALMAIRGCDQQDRNDDYRKLLLRCLSVTIDAGKDITLQKEIEVFLNGTADQTEVQDEFK